MYFHGNVNLISALLKVYFLVMTSKRCAMSLLSPSLQCSRSCGGGSQVRHVMCLDHKGQKSKDCSSRNKPFHYQRCSNQPCPTSPGHLNQAKNCNDVYSRGICFYVIQANFCRYSHYRTMCCHSCRRRH